MCVRPSLCQTKGLKLLCANPDIIVDRGDKREWCAGAVAQAYSEMGGTSLYFGKPHAPIYDLARRRLSPYAQISQMIVSGDWRWDHNRYQGAIGEGIDSLFITGGLAAKETATVTQPDPEKLSQYVSEKQLDPTFSIGFLR